MSNPFVGFEIFTKRHNGNGNNGHPFGEDSHLDDDSILERPGDVDTGENYMEPPDFDDDDLDDIEDQATLPSNVRQAIEARDSEANFSEPDDYDYEPEVNQAQRNWKEETEQRDEELDKPRKLPQSEVYNPEEDSYESENLSGDDFVKALGNAIDAMETKQGIGDVARKVGKKVGRAVTYKDPYKGLKRESDVAGPQNTPEKRQAAVARLQEYQGEKAKGDRWGRGPKPRTSTRSRSRQNEFGDIKMSHDSFVKALNSVINNIENK